MTDSVKRIGSMSARAPAWAPLMSRSLWSRWYWLSGATAVAQIVLGTGLLFVLMSTLVFVLVPTVYGVFARLDTLLGYIFLACMAKLFLVSQWIKIGFLQAADSYLDSPGGTMFVLLLGVVAFWLTGLIIWPVLAGRGGLVKPPQDPRFLAVLAVVAVGLSLFSVVFRHKLGLNRVGDGEYEEGRGLVLVFFLGQLMPLAVACLAARAAILSDGRRFIDPLVVAVLLATLLQGLWENQRTIMFAGAVAYVMTYLSYGGRVRLRHLAFVGLAGVLMQLVVFPVIDLQRGLERGMSTESFLDQTLKIGAGMFDDDARAEYSERLDAMYWSWSTRLYYGEPTGFLDRFGPGPLDEAVTHFSEVSPFGLDVLAAQAAWGVPNVVLGPLGLERPVRGGELLETDIYGRFTNLNFGVFAEIVGGVGVAWFLPACILVLAVYAVGLHVIYGGIRRNYFSAFGFSTMYFTFAVSDLADIIPQLTVQGILNLVVFGSVAFITGQVKLQRGA